MNLELTEDEQMLVDLAERFVRDRYDLARRREYRASKDAFSSENWALLGELGLIQALFDGRHGGLGVNATGVAKLFETLGRGLLVEPLLENVMVAGRLLAEIAGERHRSLVDEVVNGSKRVALAHAEAVGWGGRLWVETRARSGPVTRLTGSKPYVIAGAGADAYIVSARSHGAPDEPSGISLYLVPADEPGLSARVWHLADGSAAVALDFSDVEVADSGYLADGVEAVESIAVMARLAGAAEALGVMDSMLTETLEHLRTREQFGARLASFQALQYRMVGQYAVVEQARALIELALVSEGTSEFDRAVDGARAFVASTALPFGHDMIQMHGGMGVTDELAIGHGHKRLLVLSHWPDNPESALDRVAQAA